MRRFISVAFATVAALITLAAAPTLVGAHETREIADGQVRLVVGFLNEPVAVGDKSGLDLRVTRLNAESDEDDVPVEGLEQTLQAEVYYVDQQMALTLEPRFGQPGAYASWFYPNAVGDYSFRIFGAIEDVTVDETFTSGPDTFGPVEERLLFPPESSGASVEANAAGETDRGSIGDGLAGSTLAGAILVAAVGAWYSLRFIRRCRSRPSAVPTAAAIGS